LLSPEELFLAEKAPKIVCRPGSARTLWGSLQRSPDPLVGFKGPNSKEGEGRRRVGGEAREGRPEGLLLHIISGYAIAIGRTCLRTDLQCSVVNVKK